MSEKCINCGRPIRTNFQGIQYQQADYTNGRYGYEPDVPSVGLNILGFLIPLVGLLLFLIYIDRTPVKARAIGKMSLIGFIVGLVIVWNFQLIDL